MRSKVLLGVFPSVGVSACYGRPRFFTGNRQSCSSSDEGLHWPKPGRSGSIDEHCAILQAQFKAGLSFVLLVGVGGVGAVCWYRGRLRIAGAAESDDFLFILRDGRRELLLNPEVRLRDQVAVPGAPAEKVVMAGMAFGS